MLISQGLPRSSERTPDSTPVSSSRLSSSLGSQRKRFRAGRSTRTSNGKAGERSGQSRKVSTRPPARLLCRNPTNSPGLRLWKNSYVFRLWAEYAATDRIALRGGVFYERTPIPQEPVDP